MRRKYIRLFVSSTFSDMVIERNLLQEKVFPKVRAHCRSKGWEFDAIDLRWGISREAGLDQRTIQICIDELHRCQTLSPKPNFLILIGDKYGWCPLPERLTKTVFNDIRLHTYDLHTRLLLERWYLYDTNAESPEYVLQPRTDRYRDDSVYDREIYRPLRKLFIDYADSHPGFEPMKLAASATELEILEGAVAVPDSSEHVMAYMRSLSDIPYELLPKFTDIADEFAERDRRQLSDLRGLILKKVKNICRCRLKYDDYLSEGYERFFTDNILSMIMRVVDNEIRNYDETPAYKIDSETTMAIARRRATTNNGISAEHLSTFVDDRSIINVYGPDLENNGILLHSIAMAMQEQRGADLIMRKPTVNENITSFDSLLHSVWNEIDSLYPTTMEFSQQNFKVRMESLQVIHPLVICLEELWALPRYRNVWNLDWMPERIAPGIKIMTTSFAPIEMHNVRDLRQSCLLWTDTFSTIFDTNLPLLHRKVTAVQRSAIIDLFARSLNEKVVTRAHTDLILWYASHLHSYDCVKLTSLTIDEIVSHVLDTLAKPEHHGPVIDYIAWLIINSHDGLSIDDISHIVAAVPDFWQSFKQSGIFHDLSVDLLPTAIVTRALADLAPFVHYQYRYGRYLYRISAPDIANAVFRRYGHDSTLLETCIHSFNYFLKDLSALSDRHALSEISAIASNYYSKDITRSFFTSLNVLNHKIRNGMDDELRADYTNVLGNPHLDPDIAADVREMRRLEFAVRRMLDLNHVPEAESTNVLLQQASQYAPGTMIRDHFDIEAQPGQEKDATPRYMYNTLGLQSMSETMYIKMPCSIPAVAEIVVSHDLAMWKDDKSGWIRTLRLHDFCEDRFNICDPKCFCIIGDDMVVVLYGGVYVRHNFKWTFATCDSIENHSTTTHVKACAIDADSIRIAMKCSDLLVIVEWKAWTPEKLQWIKALRFDNDFDIIDIFNSGALVAMRFRGEEKEKASETVVSYSVLDINTMQWRGQWDNHPGCCFNSNPLYYVAHATGHIFAFAMPGDDFLTVVDYANNTTTTVPINLAYMRYPIYFIHISADCSNILTCAGDQRVMRYDIASKSLKHLLTIRAEQARFFATPDNSLLLTDLNCRNGIGAMLNLGSADVQTDYLPDALYQLAADAAGRLVVQTFGLYPQFTDSAPLLLRIADDGKPSLANADSLARNPYARSVAVTPDGRTYAYSRAEKIYLHTPDGSDTVIDIPEVLRPEVDWRLDIVQLQFSRDGHHLIGFFGDGAGANEMYWGMIAHSGTPNVPKRSVCRGFIIDISHPDFPCRGIDSALPGIGHADMMMQSRSGDVLYVCDRHSGRCAAVSLGNDSRPVPMEHNLFRPGVQLYMALAPDGSVQISDSPFDISPLGSIVRIENADGSCKVVTSRHSYTIDLAKEFSQATPGSKVLYVKWCVDARHFFVICSNGVLLIDDDEGRRVQYFDAPVPEFDDGLHLFTFASANMHQPHVYGKGLIYSDGNHVLRIEPANSCSISNPAIAVLSPTFNLATRRYGPLEATCSMCGHRFSPSVDALRDLHNGLSSHPTACPGCHHPLRLYHS